MSFAEKIKSLHSNEEFRKVKKYIRRPFVTTALVTSGIAVAVIVILLLSGQMENLIISMNLRYNSSVFKLLGGAFIAVQLGSLGYGIFLSLRKYHRPGGKGMVNITYQNGSSYKAFGEAVREAEVIKRKQADGKK